MGDRMKDRDDEVELDAIPGYVPKADATRRRDVIKAPSQAAHLEEDQTARRPDHSREDPAHDEELEDQESGTNRGGRYGDGW